MRLLGFGEDFSDVNVRIGEKIPDAAFSGDLAATADAVWARHSKTAMTQVRAMVVRFRVWTGTA